MTRNLLRWNVAPISQQNTTTEKIRVLSKAEKLKPRHPYPKKDPLYILLPVIYIEHQILWYIHEDSGIRLANIMTDGL